jgi:hypothetical protein
LRRASVGRRRRARTEPRHQLGHHFLVRRTCGHFREEGREAARRGDTPSGTERALRSRA